MKKYVKLVLTISVGQYIKTIAEPKVVEDSKEYVVFDVGSARTKVFKESFDQLLRSQVISDNKKDILQRIAWCEEEKVDELERKFIADAKKHFMTLRITADNSLKSIQKREEELDVQ